MRFLHVSNIVSHHQLPLARSLGRLLGEGCFRFAATQPPYPERQRLGWSFQADEPWVLRAGERRQDRAEFERWWLEADVVLCGERICGPFAARLQQGKMLFYMSERWWKPPIGILRLAHPGFLRMALQFRRLAACPQFHFLAIGRRSAADIRRLAPFPGRMWQWAYFADMPVVFPACERSGETFRVLWAGRMVPLKRLDTLVRAFARLREQSANVRLMLIGDGPCRGELERMVARLGLIGTVSFEPSMPVLEVRQRMRQSHVYVLASNGYEGWGVVITEAMMEGCAVVASRAAGVAATLLRDGENGLLFDPGDWQALASRLCRLRDDERLRLRLAISGQREIASTWSPQVGGERLVELSGALLSGRSVPRYADGPLMPL